MVTLFLVGAALAALQGAGLWVACRLVGTSRDIPTARVPHEFVTGEWEIIP